MTSPSKSSSASPNDGFSKFITQIDGTERTFEVSGEGDLYRVRSHDGVRLVQWTSLGHGRHLFTVDGRPYVARVHRAGIGEYIVETGGRQSMVRASDEISARASRAPENQRGASGPVEIVAPMPGTVIQVLVSDGDRVLRGQALFTIEAMKMQNEIAAPIAGVISEVRVEPGQAVEARFRFCRLEP